jgi:hypothetical protein
MFYDFGPCRLRLNEIKVLQNYSCIEIKFYGIKVFPYLKFYGIDVFGIDVL